MIHLQHLWTSKCGKFRLFRRNDYIANKSDNQLWKTSLLLGDFNIDVKRKGVSSNNLSDFCDLFHLTNIIKFDSCFTKTHASLIDLVLTNQTSSFNKTLVSETGLSDYQKIITTFFKLHFSRLISKIIRYRNYKTSMSKNS